jgi:hypothetical protein
MVKKTETKKDAGKKKGTAKKTKKPQETKKTENVIEQVVNNEEEPKETLEEKEPITVDLSEQTEEDVAKMETEEGGVEEPVYCPFPENVKTSNDEEEAIFEIQVSEESAGDGLEEDDMVDEQKDEPEEEETSQNEQDAEVSEEKRNISERNISGAEEEFVTEDSGNEIETGNIVAKQSNKTVEEKKPKKKNKIIQYLSYLWNGVEID